MPASLKQIREFMRKENEAIVQNQCEYIQMQPTTFFYLNIST